MHEEERLRLWQALGNQPGVSAWFAVWLLARLNRAPQRRPAKAPRLGGEQCTA